MQFHLYIHPELLEAMSFILLGWMHLAGLSQSPVVCMDGLAGDILLPVATGISALARRWCRLGIAGEGLKQDLANT